MVKCLPSDTSLRNLSHSPGLLPKLGEKGRSKYHFPLLEETSVELFMKLKAIKGEETVQ